MKNNKIIIMILLIIQMIQVFTNITPVHAQISKGDEVVLLRRS